MSKEFDGALKRLKEFASRPLFRGGELNPFNSMHRMNELIVDVEVVLEYIENQKKEPEIAPLKICASCDRDYRDAYLKKDLPPNTTGMCQSCLLLREKYIIELAKSFGQIVTRVQAEEIGIMADELVRMARTRPFDMKGRK